MLFLIIFWDTNVDIENVSKSYFFKRLVVSSKVSTKLLSLWKKIWCPGVRFREEERSIRILLCLLSSPKSLLCLLLIKLHLYDPASSTTYQKVGCGGFTECPFNVTYLDEDSINGMIVEDVISLPQVTGNFETKSMCNASMKFGCASKLQGNGVTKPRNALDGLIGFGRGRGSAISQLAASKKIKNMFAHCFNNENGGGIFAIGEVVSPKVKTTPLVPKTAGYKVFLKKIDVGGDFLQLPSYMIDQEGPEGGVELDTGSTLTIFPRDIHKLLMDKVLEGQPRLKLWKDEEEMLCFKYMENIDDKFPAVTFHFVNSLSMTIYPHDYLLLDESDKNWCVAWMPDTSNDPRFNRLMILGDVALQNKLIIYDLEDETVGWTEFDCPILSKA